MQDLRVFEKEFEDYDGYALSREDQCCLDVLTENTKRDKGGHEEMPLPFKEENPSLPGNYQISFRRAISLKHHFERRPMHYKLFCEFMPEIIWRRDCEQVPESQLKNTPRWYTWWFFMMMNCVGPSGMWDGCRKCESAPMDSIVVLRSCRDLPVLTTVVVRSPSSLFCHDP